MATLDCKIKATAPEVECTYQDFHITKKRRAASADRAARAKIAAIAMLLGVLLGRVMAIYL